MNHHPTTVGTDSNASEASGPADARLVELDKKAREAVAHPFTPAPVRSVVHLLVELLNEQHQRIAALESARKPCEDCGNRQGDDAFMAFASGR